MGAKSQRTRKSSLPTDVSLHGAGEVVFWLVIASVGLGLVSLAVVKAMPVSRARIFLERTATHDVRGSLSFVLAGVPIFWRSLDGLHHLEAQDYSRGDFTGRRQKYVGDMTISRVGFMGADGRTLAWAERAFVLNARSRIDDFLTGNEPTFLLMEDVSPLAMAGGLTAATRIAFALSLFAGGMLCAGSGLRGLLRCVFSKADSAVARPPASQADAD